MTKNKSNKNKKEDKWIPLAYHRIQKIHLGEDGKGYTSLKDFFNAMVTKYKFRIESGILQSDHTLVTYDDKNKLLVEINLKPTIEQRNSAGLAEMVDKFVLSWCKSHPAKYLFRLHLGYLMADDNKEITFNFMAEDLIEAYSKQFRIITKENVANTLELVEIRSEREAPDPEKEPARIAREIKERREFEKKFEEREKAKTKKVGSDTIT